MAIDTPLFAAHSRHWRDNRYVYPVISRRSQGLSIGINLNPDTACNFDCVYCSVDRTQAPTAARASVDLAVVRTELDHLITLAVSGELFTQAPFDATPPALRRLNDIAFSGDGEPTTFPGFAEACRLAMDILAWHHAAPEVRVVVITNATLLAQTRVQQGLDVLAARGEVWAKLDAGTSEYYRTVDRTEVPYERILDNLLIAGRRRPLVIQSLFARLHGVPPTPAEIEAWIGRLAALRASGATIARVQVYTTARATAESWVTPLAAPEVDAIAAQVQALGIPAQAFYAPE
jgi:wyosine [tRNA(Phe)-imidazoG37] synthetase (radical SAM superfamily)